MLIPLDRIGLTKYTSDAYKYFLKRKLITGGDDDGKIASHQQWGNLSGSVIWGISEHLKHSKDANEFEYFRPYLNRLLDWIQRERQKSYSDGSMIPGIFPVGKGTDWNDKAQFWCFTDGQNIMGIRSMAEAYKIFGADEKDYVMDCYKEYLTVMNSIIDKFYHGHEEDEDFIFPHMPGEDFEDTEQVCYFLSGAPYLFSSGIIPCESKKFEQMERYFIRRGMFDHGLAGRLTSVSRGDSGNLSGNVYYTVNGERMWIKAWLERGEHNKATDMFMSLLKYGMTSEYVVSERYSSKDPWYNPWQPNASSTGRIIDIMLRYFGEIERKI